MATPTDVGKAGKTATFQLDETTLFTIEIPDIKEKAKTWVKAIKKGQNFASDREDFIKDLMQKQVRNNFHVLSPGGQAHDVMGGGSVSWEEGRYQITKDEREAQGTATFGGDSLGPVTPLLVSTGQMRMSYENGKVRSALVSGGSEAIYEPASPEAKRKARQHHEGGNQDLHFPNLRARITKSIPPRPFLFWTGDKDRQLKKEIAKTIEEVWDSA